MTPETASFLCFHRFGKKDKRALRDLIKPAERALATAARQGRTKILDIIQIALKSAASSAVPSPGSAPGGAQPQPFLTDIDRTKSRRFCWSFYMNFRCDGIEKNTNAHLLFP